MPKDYLLPGILAVTLLSSASIAAASGTITSPERQQKMESFGACLAFSRTAPHRTGKAKLRSPEMRRAIAVR